MTKLIHVHNACILPDSCIFFLNSEISLFMSARFLVSKCFVCDMIRFYEYFSIQPVIKCIGSMVMGRKQLTHFPHLEFVLKQFCPKTVP